MRRVVPAALAASLLVGCGVGAGDPPTDVRLRVTDDFGARTLLDQDRPEIAGQDTVMRLLQRATDVDTAYGGAFVTSIAGRSGGEDGRDWLFFVDGTLADRGATAVRLRDGDRVWWDRNRTALAPVGAVVGSFPAPFRRSGAVDVTCVAVRSRSCRTAVGRLRATGARPAVRSAGDTPSAGGGPQVVVGAWPRLRRLDATTAFAAGPRRSGVFAVPTPRGLAVYDREGRAGSAQRRWGLVAAMRPRGGRVTWLVTGATEPDAAAAAGDLREDVLRGRFASIRQADGPSTALPVAPR